MNNETKYALLEKVLRIANHQTKEIKALKKEITEYLGKDFKLKDYNPFKHDSDEFKRDPQLVDAALLLEIYLVEAKEGDFKKCSKLAAPILARVGHTNNKDFYDVRLAANVIGLEESIWNFSRTVSAIENELERHHEHERYESVKMVLYINVLGRLVRSRFYDLPKFDDPDETKRFENFFMNIYNSISELYEENEEKFWLRKTVADIRKGIFFNQQEEVQDGFEALEAKERHDVLEMMRDEAEKYDFFAKQKMTPEEIKVGVGKNIKTLRENRELSQIQVANILKIDAADIDAIEQGKKDLLPDIMFKLADIFNVGSHAFFINIAPEPPKKESRRFTPYHSNSDYRDSLHRRVLDAIELMSTDKMEIVVNAAEGLAKIHSKEGKAMLKLR
ncbi:MAG: helix-turn-helix domain-containing protein [Defluviitaleaceae bacterium]|nr:helix-turn-helix domain-containing protein [Defluviitaleaceae bacterium]